MSSRATGPASSRHGDALHAREADETAAGLAAELGALAFSSAYARWAAPKNRQPFIEIAHLAMRDLQARAATLGTEDGARALIRCAAELVAAQIHTRPRQARNACAGRVHFSEIDLPGGLPRPHDA